ncbi:MAG: LysM peptidoglycan-binding domain-containing protein [Sphingobacteriales bacterium]|nr:MAG: LysM peptidoglycan-binding domain-containing protein [Sphingobacteriales bacterium]
MFKFPVALVALLIFSFQSIAQSSDSLRVVSHNDRWVIKHSAKAGENVFSIARKYHVPAAILTEINELNYQSVLANGQEIYISLGAYNQITTPPTTPDVRPMYYVVDELDNLFRIAKYAGVQQKTLQQWNRLADNSIHEGQHLLVGWVLYDATTVVNSVSNPLAVNKSVAATTAVKPIIPQPAKPIAKDDDDDTIIIVKKAAADTLSPAEKLFLSQTNNGQSINEEKGTAVFFDMKKIAGSKVVYAFHNTARKGTVIKVHNPGNNITIYAKVLGPIPGTKQYHESIIGLDGSAQQMLGTTDDRLWCELQFGY